jgi:hypothetical protein
MTKSNLVRLFCFCFSGRNGGLQEAEERTVEQKFLVNKTTDRFIQHRKVAASKKENR